MNNFEIESLIPAVVLSGIYFFYQKKNKGKFGPISFLIMLYLLMAVLSIVARSASLVESVFEISIIPMIYLSICIGISLWGFMPYTDASVSIIRIDNFGLYRKIETFLLISSFLSILFFLPSALSAFQGDINEMRTTEAFKVHIDELSKWGYVNTFCSLIGNLFVFNIFFAFFNLTPKFRNSKKSSNVKAGLLFAASLVYVVYVLAYVGRDGVVLWILSVITVFLFLKQFIGAGIRRTLFPVFIISILILIIPFVIITLARFSVHEAGVAGGFWFYIGDQVTAFNDQFIATIFSPPLWGQQNFPIFYKIFNPGFSEFDRVGWIEAYTLFTNVMPWHFATYVGAFLADFGYFITPVVVLFIAIITRLSARRVVENNVMTLSQLMIFILCYQMILFGVFYFKHSASNLFIITVLFMALILKLSRKSKSCLDIEKR